MENIIQHQHHFFFSNNKYKSKIAFGILELFFDGLGCIVVREKVLVAAHTPKPVSNRVIFIISLELK